jgi:hypothetical protein
VPWTDPDGYYQVTLRTTGAEIKRFPVHSLVAFAFIGPPPFPWYQVAHNDGHPDNNVPNNLRWATASGDQKDRFRHNVTERDWLGRFVPTMGRRARALARRQA